MSELPIYAYIRDSIVDGVLPPSFNLGSYDRTTSKVPFADGGLDGIAVYHMIRPQLPDDLPASIGEGISLACSGDYEAADAAFCELGNECRAVELIDELQGYVLSHQESISPQTLKVYVLHLLAGATDKELIKIGLSFLELFSEPCEEEKQIVRTLALSDEFTLFAAWCARNWANGNQELFEMAKKTEGWGRVHVVDMLEPESEEIRDWLLREGINNYVMPEYSALTCYEKAGVAERLERGVDHGEFSAITSIVCAALSDEPVAGLFALDNPKAELERYIKQAEVQPLDIEDCECVRLIAARAEAKGWEDLAAQCNALLESDSVRTLVVDAVSRGRGLSLASKLGIPYEDALLEAMRSDFDDLWHQCGYLTDSPKHLSALLELFREKVPLDSIEDDPRDEIGLGKEFDTYNKLSMLLQYLRHKMPVGLDYVTKALTSPVVNNRTMSHRVLRCWVNDEGRPLSKISPETYNRLLCAYEREPREDLRKKMKPLIDGKTAFDKSEM